MSDRTRILFLCTGNSARSILAEVIANEMFGDQLEARSAGSRPKGEIHHLAKATLMAHGLPTFDSRSKSWDELTDDTFDLVVTLCDAASKERCPYFPGAPVRVHWGLPDPPESDEAEEMFEQVFQALMEALEAFTEAPDYDLPAKAEIAARRIHAHFPQNAGQSNTA